MGVGLSAIPWNRWRRLNLLVLVSLALILPFELEAPWLRLGPVVLTNVEVVQWAALGLTFLTWLHAGRPLPHMPKTWAWLLIPFVTTLFLSGLLAPELQMNALKAALRTAGGLGLALAVAISVRGRRHLLWIAGGLVAAGLLAAVVGLAEIVYGIEFGWLPLFRATPTVAGRFPRLAGPFDYANQAAMFIEATLPLLLAFVWHVGRARRYLLALLLGAAVLLYLQAAILTFSRAAMATLLLVNFTLAALLWIGHGQHRRQVPLFAGAIVAIFALVGANFFINPVFRLRFQSESDNDWYLARFQVPAALTIDAGEERLIPVTVTNEGFLTWRSAGAIPINLAARWVQPQSGRELSRRPRWLLTQPVAPGETLTMEVPLQAPRVAGKYHLVWDMVQEDVVWFGAKTGRQASSVVTVLAAPNSADTVEPGTNRAASEQFEAAWEYQAPIPGRLTLWTIAWRLWQQRPWLGLGLDNFRLLYGRELGYAAWNTSIHTNNWYVETVVSLGILGALPFLIWLGLLTLDMARQLRRPAATVWQAAIAAGLLAYLVHGLFDYFLLFNATGLLFWMLVGLWLAVAHQVAVSDNGPQ